MKWLVWLLIFLNIGLAAYFNMDKWLPKNTVVPSNHQEINPQQIKLLSQQEIEALPKKEAPPPPKLTSEPPPEIVPEIACYEWGSFSREQMAKARTVTARLKLKTKIKQNNSQETVRYWIYIPKFQSADEAHAKVEELKAMGVEDVFVVQEPQWQNAISLGVFKDEQLAYKLLDELRDLGVATAEKGVRNQEAGQASLLISQMGAAAAADIKKLKPDFPGSELKIVGCE